MSSTGSELMSFSGQIVSEKINQQIINKASGPRSWIKTNKIEKIAEYVTDTAGI